ncbi:hypothetical protein Tco_1095169, partial [Tanacetum coccineum]
ITKKCKEIKKVQKDKQNEDVERKELSKKLSTYSNETKQLSEINIEDITTPTFWNKNLKNINDFSPVVFYCSPEGVPPKRPSRLLSLLHEIRAEVFDENKSREDIWTTFARQDEAIKYAKKPIGLHIFSYKDHISKQRRFLVSTNGEFWHRYKQMNYKFRNHYEIIQEEKIQFFFQLEGLKAKTCVGEDCKKLLIGKMNLDFIKVLHYDTECYDPDCRGYRSPFRTLPESILCDFNIIIKENTTEDSLDENVIISSDKEFWWREAILVAENLENMPRKVDFSKEILNNPENTELVVVEMLDALKKPTYEAENWVGRNYVLFELLFGV